MLEISENYASQFQVDLADQDIDFTSYYFKLARQLGNVADCYNRSYSEDIFKGYKEVAGMIERLAIMYKKDNLIEEINNEKQTIQTEFNYLIMDLENYFGSYPDEISRRDIANGKILIHCFNKL